MTGLSWYLRRLRAMAPQEWIFHARRSLQVAQERRAWGQASPAAKSPEFRGQPARQNPGVLVPNDSVGAFARAFPGARERVIGVADDLLAGKFVIFGRSFELGWPPKWGEDPLTSQSWPTCFWADINLRDAASVGGPLWTWELNRCHFLQTLARAGALSGDPRYPRAIIEALLSWVETNPPGTGINWSNPLEVSIRAINWTWAVSYAETSSDLPAEDLDRVAQSLMDHMNHVSRHLSAYSSANNHLIGEAAGLVIVGAYLAQASGARQWLQTGLSIQTRELERQIHPDGVPAEQAIAYLAFDLELAALAWAVAARSGRPVPEVWRQRLTLAADFLAHLMDENGGTPALGDDSGATALGCYDRPQTNRYRSVMSMAASVLAEPGIKSAAMEWDEFAQHALGAEGKKRFDGTPGRQQPLRSKAFPTGGYAVMRSLRRLIVFDCGPLGYLSTAAHGHADALSLWMHLDGRPLMVDAGTYAYHEAGEWRSYFRGTAAHNTIVIDSADQSQSLGTFLWGRKARARLVRWETTPEYDLAIGVHNGYQRRGVTHRRSLYFLKPDRLLVADDLLGRGVHFVQQLWHFPKDAEVYPAGDDWQVQVEGAQMRLSFSPQAELDAQIIVGRREPIQGWVSEGYGDKAPAPVVERSGNLALPARLVTTFNLRPEASEKGDPIRLTTELIQLIGGDLEP